MHRSDAQKNDTPLLPQFSKAVKVKMREMKASLGLTAECPVCVRRVGVLMAKLKEALLSPFPGLNG